MFIQDDTTKSIDKEKYDKRIDKILIDHQCLYKVFHKLEDDTTFITLSGKGINAYGNSKLEGADGLQQSFLRALYRSLKDKRNEICNDYNYYIKE